MKTTVVAVVGSKSSGKTTTIEVLTKELAKRGHKIAAVKHIPERNFTIDSEEKDTWRFAKSGAKTIISVASNEIATIQKTDTTSLSLVDILQRCKNADFVFLEGFKRIVAKNCDVPKIVTVKSAEEALEALKVFEPIIVLTSLHPIETLNFDVPYVNVRRNGEKIVDLIEKYGREKCQRITKS